MANLASAKALCALYKITAREQSWHVNRASLDVIGLPLLTEEEATNEALRLAREYPDFLFSAEPIGFMERNGQP